MMIHTSAKAIAYILHYHNYRKSNRSDFIAVYLTVKMLQEYSGITTL